MIKGAPDRSERATQSTLAKRLQLAQSTVAELVERAEEAGLVRREPQETNQHLHWLRLTAEGEERLANALTGLEAERLGLFEALDHRAAGCFGL